MIEKFLTQMSEQVLGPYLHCFVTTKMVQVFSRAQRIGIVADGVFYTEKKYQKLESPGNLLRTVFIETDIETVMKTYGCTQEKPIEEFPIEQYVAEATEEMFKEFSQEELTELVKSMLTRFPGAAALPQIGVGAEFINTPGGSGSSDNTGGGDDEKKKQELKAAAEKKAAEQAAKKAAAKKAAAKKAAAKKASKKKTSGKPAKPGSKKSK